MKLLRQTIRKIILESEAQDEFFEWLYNVDDPSQDPARYSHLEREDSFSTLHRDMATMHQYTSTPEYVSSPGSQTSTKNPTKRELDGYFNLKRDIKRKWNELADHGFWQGPKMKYFHDLTYYDGQANFNDEDDLPTGQLSDETVFDISMKKFLEIYKIKGNKDEMSTWGVHKGRCRADLDYGLLLTGRVTLAHNDDAFTESRSKASAADMQKHVSSGLPKRVPPHRAPGLLFNEEDISKSGRGTVGECILDNWSIEAIVIDKRNRKFNQIQQIASSLNIPLVDKYLKEIT